MSLGSDLLSCLQVDWGKQIFSIDFFQLLWFTFINFISVSQQVNDLITCVVWHRVSKTIAVPWFGPVAGPLDFLKEGKILSKLYLKLIHRIIEFFILLKVQGDEDFLFLYCDTAGSSQRGYAPFGSISSHSKITTTPTFWVLDWALPNHPVKQDFCQITWIY